jgi:hypothetical protein
MRWATLSSCSMRTRSLISRSRRCCVSSSMRYPWLHSSAILPPTMRVVTVAELWNLRPVGAKPANSPIVNAAMGDAAYHLIPFGYLILYVEA